MLSTGVLWILIVNHMEPDHAGSIRLLRQQYPDVQIVGNKQTFGMLNGYHGISTGLYEVKEGDTLSVVVTNCLSIWLRWCTGRK